MRAAGSETTFYLMNAIGNLYSQSSIFGCTLSTTDFRTCVTGSDGSATDVKDNYSRDEFDNGAGIGSSKGIAQLCGSSPTGGLTVDFARSSRALKSSDFSGSCTSSNLLAENYADDAVVPVTFGFVGKTAISSTPACTTALISGGGLVNGTCQIGPVASGWLPGDPLAGPYTGKAFTNLTTVGGTSSLANRIYCTTTNPNPITDWGQLTNIGTGAPGSGTPIGVPIYVPFVNTGSGTYSTWTGVVGCDPNIPNKDAQVAQENDAPQMADLGAGGAASAKRWPDYTGTDAALTGTPALVDQSNQVAASFYYMSFGVSQWKSFTGSVAIPAGCTGSGCVNKSPATQLLVDNVAQSPSCDFNSGGCFDVNGNPVTQSNSARKLFNVVRTDTLRGSVAGFLNYVCDAQNTGEYGTDLTTGKNYGTELSVLVSTQFVFPYQPCTRDGSGHSTIPFVAPGETPPTGGAAVPSALLNS